MERQKSILGRKKGRGPAAAPGDFIALGKQSKPAETDVKRPSSPQTVARKKESLGLALSSASVAKKPKFGGSLYGTLSRPHGDGAGSSVAGSSLRLHEDIAIVVEPTEFLQAVLSAEDDQNEERSEALLCGAVKTLRSTRSKPDTVLYLSLMHLSKTKANLFSSDVVIEAFCSLLKREIALTFKAKGNPLVSVLACNILMNAFSDEENWPDSFVKVFVEDSLGERVWVDREDCRSFVENIMTAFGTKRSPKHLLMTTAEAVRVDSPGSSSPVPMLMDVDDNSKICDSGDGDRGSSNALPPFPRYPFQQNVIESYILDTTKDILNRRQSMDSSSRNLIRLMTSTCGYSEIRNMAGQRIDMWLQNPKLTRVSQDLLLAVCTNCDKHDQSDLEVIGHLTKMRMKTKPLINHFLNCMRELLSQHPENLRMILNHTIYNELSTSRNPNNMPLLTVVFSHSPDQAAKILAEIFQDLLINKDDYLKALRILLREIVRCTRLDMNFSTFCLGLMHERTETKFVEIDPVLKERYVMSLADLISMDILLSIAPSIREAAAGFMQGDHKNLELIHVFKRQVGIIQRDAVWWLHMVVPKIVELKPEAYLHCLKKVLFLESAEHYYSKDNWPPESERGMMLKLASESPVMEDTLMRLLVIGLLPDLPLSAPEAVELVDQLVCRAASLIQDLGMGDVLHLEQLEFIDALLKLCVYKHPESIPLPVGYTPPNLAITVLMWKAWLTLLVITAYNPSVFGETAWQKFPTLQSLMEMIMTNNYTFPPPTSVTNEKMAEDIKARERQIRQQEIHLILEFESHLAAATSKMTITESTSLLIGQLNHNDPHGPARFPPQEVIERLKTLNSSLKLGQILCRSRNPDFLLHIINRQGTSKSMPWLAELVESSEGSLDVLPVQCLCEFLLHEPSDLANDGDVDDIFGADRSKRKQKNKKHQQLLSRLQELVHTSSTDSATMKEVLDYFLQRLSSTQAATRQQAVKGLSLVVAPEPNGSDGDESMDVDIRAPETDEWLLQHVTTLPLFYEIIESLCAALMQACQVETDPKRVRSYVMFLAHYGIEKPQSSLNELVQVMAQLLVERTSVANHILPDIATLPHEKTATERATEAAFAKIFVAYMRIARNEEGDDTFSWSNTQDQIRLQWESGQSATMHVLVIRAIIILLTYGRPSGDEEDDCSKIFDELFDMWIQENNRMPHGYLVDTSEEALLLPDWLKLRMLRSTDERIVDAALQEVEPTQLVPLIQWFGIPVASMSRLLAALDQAVAADPDLMAQAVGDAVYMASLIDIQHQRGAVGGKNFYKILQQGKKEETKADTDLSEAEMETKTEDSWSIKNTGDVILPNSAEKMARILDQIFTNTSSSDKTPASLFQTIIQAVSTDKTKAATIVKAFDNLLSSSKREAFAQKVYATTWRSCPVLKILIAKQTDLHPEIAQMLEKLQSLAPSQRSMLTSVMTQFLLSRGKQSKQLKGTSTFGSGTSKQMVDALVNKCSSAKKGLDSDIFLQGLKKLKDPESMELAVQQMMNGLLAQGRTKEGTKLACHALAQSGSSMHEGAATLFIDWMSLLDPEIVQSNPELEQTLLFARTVKNKEASKTNQDAGPKKSCISSQAHLLALLTHQASWSTLIQCLTRLLQPGKIHQLDPTAVLDFLWACEHIPKIWQGREKSTQKVEFKEDVLTLTSPQLTVVVDLIIEEMLLLAKVGTPEGQQNITPDVLNGRMDLLLHCICEDIEKVIVIIDHLQGVYSEASGLKRLCVTNLAASLYLQFPYIQAWLEENSPLLSQVMTSNTVQSQMDVISHRLISGLGMIGHGHKSQNRMSDANISCRKMAAHHPDIFLRQLSLLGSILAGQTQFTIGEMRHSGRLQLFTHALGLVELLQPHVFGRQHCSSFSSVLDSFFSLMK
ncbi:integrator complex subunit 1, partial [Plakobranchus ocellatus]